MARDLRTIPEPLDDKAPAVEAVGAVEIVEVVESMTSVIVLAVDDKL
eukprot:CAMPEP_0175041140 /NCGR_PEP_ID=MMETSP0052_2-20121109/1739_1 /TAXON_ID=51329 ORGANISM="Polytomella parva, Strain SAG 63-3" /NCGR_SAMPLE_ID=MMETSP0052_2 /ASSEMBLY_ACC=CAM_ASM_000194 /LENGTH=46 /DNA_ID= /DNA_START= /DNA_END= /DNA_ORIENTATION=